MSDLNWLPGPAFLSWFRMGNLQKWAGPPSDFWISSQLNLAQRIINRMVNDFGMDPVVPAFSGFLPDEFSSMYPDAEVQKLTSWSGFNCTNSCITWLEPSDPLFKQFQESYTSKQEKMLGFKPTYYALGTSHSSKGFYRTFHCKSASEFGQMTFVRGWKTSRLRTIGNMFILSQKKSL